MERIIKVPFNSDLHSFLAVQGYTHIYNKGVEGDRLPIKDDSDIEYIIIPLNPGDPHFKEAAIAEKIEEINSGEVNDMARGYPLIKFVLEMPLTVYEKFILSEPGIFE